MSCPVNLSRNFSPILTGFEAICSGNQSLEMHHGVFYFFASIFHKMQKYATEYQFPEKK